MFEMKDNECIISRELKLNSYDEGQLLVDLKSLWASQGCSISSWGVYKYTFAYEGEMPSSDGLKEANELLDRVKGRLHDLQRIIAVVKVVMVSERERIEQSFAEKLNMLSDDIKKQKQDIEKSFTETLNILSDNIMKQRQDIKELVDARVESAADLISIAERLDQRMDQPEPDCLRSIRGKVSVRVQLALERSYKEGYLADKPIEELTDAELLSIRNMGLKSLVEIRQIIPGPDAKEDRQ